MRDRLLRQLALGGVEREVALRHLARGAATGPPRARAWSSTLAVFPSREVVRRPPRGRLARVACSETSRCELLLLGRELLVAEPHLDAPALEADQLGLRARDLRLGLRLPLPELAERLLGRVVARDDVAPAAPPSRRPSRPARPLPPRRARARPGPAPSRGRGRPSCVAISSASLPACSARLRSAASLSFARAMPASSVRTSFSATKCALCATSSALLGLVRDVPEPLELRPPPSRARRATCSSARRARRRATTRT